MNWKQKPERMVSCFLHTFGSIRKVGRKRQETAMTFVKAVKTNVASRSQTKLFQGNRIHTDRILSMSHSFVLLPFLCADKNTPKMNSGHSNACVRKINWKLFEGRWVGDENERSQ